MATKTLRKGYLSIGTVVETLKKEFKDLSISKVRYLEDEGLIEPKRTSGGYRRFSPSDVDRLRLVLRLQKERYLPLSVIREKIKNISTSSVKSDDLISAPKGEIKLEKKLVEKGRNYTVEEASDATGLSTKEISELESYGLVQTISSDKGQVYDSGSVRVMRLVRDLSKHGIQARHLRMYQTFAERESTLLEQIVAPVLRQKSTDAQEKAVRHLNELSGLAKQLRETLLINSLRSFVKET